MTRAVLVNLRRLENHEFPGEPNRCPSMFPHDAVKKPRALTNAVWILSKLKLRCLFYLFQILRRVLWNISLRISFDGLTVFVEPADFQGSDFARGSEAVTTETTISVEPPGGP